MTQISKRYHNRPSAAHASALDIARKEFQACIARPRVMNHTSDGSRILRDPASLALTSPLYRVTNLGGQSTVLLGLRRLIPMCNMLDGLQSRTRSDVYPQP